VWAVVGIVLGGRLGYVLFYKPEYYFENPGQILHLWEGGMSFHGGMLGVIFAFYLFARKYHIHFMALIDLITCATPIGLFLGRIANFINGELYGRVTASSLGMMFPNGGPLPRYPSQLFEAALEGLVLFALMMYFLKKTRARDKVGLLSGLFLLFYGLARTTCEFFREPDAQLGFLYAGATMGQLLCVPMILGGFYLIFRKAH
ncbi:MAG: prolipoprotein diacylglyceryl transferase, partial [Alphaproteobacteria bacterium]|nr:prolipoprotein diacylglyceryl transferase [Alphaproteobacteria bacterium]